MIARILRGGLWTVSAALSVLLFTDLARDTVSLAVLAFLAVALEALKLEAWNGWTRERRPALLAIAAALAGLSLVASAGAAAVLVQARAAESTKAAALADYRAADLAAIDERIDAGIARIRVIPADYSTAARNQAAELDGLRAERTRLVETIAAAPAASGGLSLFHELAGLLDIDEGRLTLAFLLAVAALLEAGILALGPRRPKSSVPAQEGQGREGGSQRLPASLAQAFAGLSERPTVNDAAAALALHPSSLYRAIQAGRLPAMPGKPCRVERDRLARFAIEEGRGRAADALDRETRDKGQTEAPAARLASPVAIVPTSRTWPAGLLACIRRAFTAETHAERSPVHG